MGAQKECLSFVLDTAASYIHMYIYVHFPNDNWVILLKQYEESVVATVASLTDKTV